MERELLVINGLDEEKTTIVDDLWTLNSIVYTYEYPSRGFDDGSIGEIIVAIGSAGAFTALYKIITTYLGKDKDKKVVIEKGDFKITIKGHKVLEEEKIFKKLFPKGISKKKEKKSEKEHRQLIVHGSRE